MRKITRHFVLLVLTIVVALPLTAQDTGQLCIRAFEDRDGSGVQDASEPLLTRGLNANLLDADGVIVRTAILDNQPTAGRGLICFRALAPGQYAVEVNSADFVATTPGTLAVQITAGEPLIELEVGVQRVTVSADGVVSTVVQPFDQDRLLERALVAGAGAAAAMLLTLVIGILIYIFTLHGKYRRVRQQEAAYRQRTTTGSMRAVRPTDTGEFRR